MLALHLTNYHLCKFLTGPSPAVPVASILLLGTSQGRARAQPLGQSSSWGLNTYSSGHWKSEQSFIESDRCGDSESPKLWPWVRKGAQDPVLDRRQCPASEGENRLAAAESWPSLPGISTWHPPRGAPRESRLTLALVSDSLTELVSLALIAEVLGVLRIRGVNVCSRSRLCKPDISSGSRTPS